MQYLGLAVWVVAIIALIVWGYSFNTRTYNLVGRRKTFFAISAFLLVIAISSLVTNGLKKGLDFTGGSIVEVGVFQETTPPAVREALADFEGLGEVSVQVGTEFLTDPKPDEGDPAQYQKVIVRLTLEGGAPLEPTQTQAVLQHLEEKFGGLKELRTASIGPTISGELTRNAIKALILALLMQLLYIFFRFGNQLRYGLTADLALVHDVIIMVGFYSLAGREIDSPFVAALLTVVGYSVMDSVVIFDRIRENLNDWWNDNPDEEHAPYEKLVNESLNQTMSRSINTTLTTLVTLLAIYYFGGDTLANFAFALLVGILAGAYSSICVAAPILVLINKKYPVQRPGDTGGWYDDDEIVPEDHMEKPAPGQPKGAPRAVQHDTDPDGLPRSGGRRRSRGKRS